jgi:hypothetical protein
MIEGTSSPSFQSSPNFMHNLNPMLDETFGLVLRPATPPPTRAFERSMTKFEMF